MFVFLFRIFEVTLLEKSLHETHPDYAEYTYAEYTRATSSFPPWLPKHSADPELQRKLPQSCENWLTVAGQDL